MASLSLSVTKTAANADLTTAGPADWAQWGHGGSSSLTPVERKSGGGSTISASLFGGSGPTWYNPDNRTLSWSDGTPDASGSSAYGVYNPDGAGTGFDIVFPADTTTRIARLYSSYFNASAKITATLSDASAGPSSDSTTLTDTGGLQGAFAEVTYAAGSSSQTLTIRIEVISGTNCTLCGAALEVGGGGGGGGLLLPQMYQQPNVLLRM